MDEKMCSGCGRLKSEGKVERPALACCPDSNYSDIPDAIEWFVQKHKKSDRRVEELEANLASAQAASKLAVTAAEALRRSNGVLVDNAEALQEKLKKVTDKLIEISNISPLPTFEIESIQKLLEED